MYPSKHKTNPEEIKEIFKSRFSYLYSVKHSEKSVDSKYNLSNKFYEKYQLEEKIKKPYKINTFQQIGWPDPFSQENPNKNKLIAPNYDRMIELKDLAYHKSRYKK